MFCPQCGTESLAKLKFCKKCGTNLRRVQGVMSKGGAAYAEDSIENVWVREELEEYRERRKRSPEEKRLHEIKSGVITSCVGLGVTIFFSLLFDAIANLTPPHVQGIIRAIPFAGVIPFLIGLGLIFNGLFVSKHIVALKRREAWSDEERDQPQPALAVSNTTHVPQLAEGGQSPVADFSIAEPTTRSLRDPAPVSRDTN
jgi:hypothetical protein